MAQLLDDTRNRWSSLEPEKFINTVIYGTLAERVKLAYTFVSVYTQIIHGLPRTRPLGPEATVALGRLRQLMKYVRACMTSANDILHGDTPTVPLSSYTSEGFILYSVGEIRSSVQEIMQTVAEIQRDELLRYTPMPGSNGRMAGAVAADIQQYMLEIKEILDFAQQYAERRARLNRTLASC